MLRTLKLKIGPNSQNQLEFGPGPMTVIVGPNNAGKSLLLREIASALAVQPSIANAAIVESVAAEQAAADLLQRTQSAVHPRPAQPDIFDLPGRPLSLQPSTYTHGGGGIPSSELRKLAVARSTIFLDGTTRLTLFSGQETSPIGQPAQNLLGALHQSPEALERLRGITADALGRHFVVDPGEIRQYRVRMFRSAPPPDIEYSLDPKWRPLIEAEPLIEELSDGVRAFSGLVAASLSGEFRVLLIDEPDAFHHPPLARRLGQILTQIAAERQGQAFAATHSPAFLMGCIESGKEVTILRLTYEDSLGQARILEASSLAQLMREPMLRSNGVLDALFHHGAVLCEGDGDRVLYGELNSRLRAAGQGARDTVFLSFGGSGNIAKVLAATRQMGIPSAAVLDLDLLENNLFDALLNAANIPADTQRRLMSSRDEIVKSAAAAGVKLKKDGLSTLPAAERGAAEEVIRSASQYGLFFVPVGELEQWFRSFAINNVNKAEWLRRVLDRLGSDPDDPAYIAASTGDVWDFVNEIARWINSSSREGMQKASPRSPAADPGA